MHFAVSVLIKSSQTHTSANKWVFPLAQFKQCSISSAHIQMNKNQKYNIAKMELIEMKHISQGKKRKGGRGAEGETSAPLRLPFICPL